MVSIIIPVYNAEKYISRCIDSIISQTYKKWEIIAIDDGSQDDSIGILMDYQRSMPEKIHVFTQQNRGVAYTRNLGVQLGSGEYIMFVDNDDYIDVSYVEEYVNEIERTKNNCVIGGFRRENSSGTIIKKFIPTNMCSVYTDDLMPWARIMRRDFLISNGIKFMDNSIGEDVYFNFLMLSKTKKISVINNMSYVWFYNEQSVSNVKQVGLNDVDAFKKLLDQIRQIYGSDKKWVDSWLVRYTVWYMLYSGRNVTSQRFIEVDRELFSWLSAVGIKSDNLHVKLFSGDSPKRRFVIRCYLVIRNTKLIKIFARLYTR